MSSFVSIAQTIFSRRNCLSHFFVRFFVEKQLKLEIMCEYHLNRLLSITAPTSSVKTESKTLVDSDLRLSRRKRTTQSPFSNLENDLSSGKRRRSRRLSQVSNTTSCQTVPICQPDHEKLKKCRRLRSDIPLTTDDVSLRRCSPSMSSREATRLQRYEVRVRAKFSKDLNAFRKLTLRQQLHRIRT